MEAELDVLRSVAEMSPVLTWRQQQDGTVVWANTAYMAAVQKQLGEEALGSWPPGKLFPGLAPQAGDLAPGTPRRVSFTRSNDDSRRWFEFRAHPGPVNTLCFASPIDNLVQAETSLKEFIGTLGKTFAQLPIGLAIFDAQRHLVLFNPALVELTGLSAEVLTQRPTLHAFLDALRENQHIPEPRDYKNWRLRIAQLEAAATGGRHQETWTLPTGQTYRVTGQPHPNGAVAFLFEDISSEISLTRRFRAEIDMGVAVLNALNYGVAVFTRNGALQFCNGRYRELWGLDPEDSVSDISLEGSLHHWGLGTEQDDIGSKLQTFVFVGGKRSKFTFRVTACDGLPCIAEVSPLPQRASLVVFRPAQNTDCTVPLDTSQRKIAF